MLERRPFATLRAVATSAQQQRGACAGRPSATRSCCAAQPPPPSDIRRSTCRRGGGCKLKLEIDAKGKVSLALESSHGHALATTTRH
jgi:hypothetical protein